MKFSTLIALVGATTAIQMQAYNSACKAGEVVCGDKCLPAGSTCLAATCKDGEVACGKGCMPAGSTCLAAACKDGEVACGDKCLPKGSTC